MSFYHFTSDDLEELNKLAILLRQKIVQLQLPEQTEIEFMRNRENKISDALKRLKDQRLNLQFPQLCKDYGLYTQLRELQRQYKEAHSELINSLLIDITKKNLKADLTINELFGLANKIPSSLEIIQGAQLRSNIGNPPGKTGSLGDAINWESLLTLPKGEPLYFVTDDKDFSSPLEDLKFDSFLLQEWSTNKKSHLFFYSKISHFFKDHFPDIKLYFESEKDNLINELASSRSYAKTHVIISKLRQYSEFTKDQINDILLASVNNGQVYRILMDEDVKEFLDEIIRNNKDFINNEVLRELEKLYSTQDSAISETPSIIYRPASIDDF